jgi:nucleoside-diphosphate-sugar epimerase
MTRSAAVLGAGGFLGLNLCRWLIRRNWAVVAVIPESQSPSASRFRHVIGQSAKIIVGDARERSVVDRSVSQCDVVFPMTAHVRPSQTVTGLQASVDSLITGTMSLLEAIRLRRGRTCAVFIGSRLQYGATGGALVHENSPMQPLSLYGACKCFEENMVMSYARRYSLPIYWLRTSVCYGPYQSLSERAPGGRGFIYVERQK